MAGDADMLDLIRRLNEGVAVRTATSRDAPAYERLLNAHYRRQKPSGYHAWRFESCPCPSCLIVAEDAGSIVGCLGGHVFRLGDGRPVLFTVDLVISEDHRNRGLSRLLEAALDEFGERHGAVALVALPNPAGRAAHESMPGSRCIGEVENLTCPTTVSAATRTTPPRRDGLRFDRHDPAFIAWRFTRNPEYRYVFLPSATPPRAIVKVYRDPAGGPSVGDIVDYESDAFTGPAGAALLQRCASTLAEQGCRKMTTWALPDTEAHAALTAAGFAAGGQKRALCVRPYGRQGEDLLDWSRWELVPADSEVF